MACSRGLSGSTCAVGRTAPTVPWGVGEGGHSPLPGPEDPQRLSPPRAPLKHPHPEGLPGLARLDLLSLAWANPQHLPPSVPSWRGQCEARGPCPRPGPHIPPWHVSTQPSAFPPRPAAGQSRRKAPREVKGPDPASPLLQAGLLWEEPAS